MEHDTGTDGHKLLKEELPSLACQPECPKQILPNLIIAVCALVLAVHLPALWAKAMSFDDRQYLTENSLVQDPGWTSVKRFVSEVLEPSTVGGYYQPLAMISLMADYALGGRPDNLMPFHRTSLVLHVINSALVIVLLYLLFGRPWVAAGLGLLFGLHPMTVETIPWVGERKTLLAAFFAFSCLILYVCYTRKGNRRLYLICLVTYLLALISKPTSTPLPLLMILMDYWPLRRFKSRTVLEKVPFLGVGAVSAIITYISQGRTADVVLPGEYAPWRIPLILCHNIVFYLCKIVWPTNLSSHYPLPNSLQLSDPMMLAGVIGTPVLIAVLLISLRWTAAALTGWLIFFIAILPTMQIVGFSNVIASDKFVYLPSIGLLMFLASFLTWLSGVSALNKSVPRCAVAAMILLIVAGSEAVATRRYLAHWRDTMSLYNHMLTLAPDAAPLHNDLGIALQSDGKLIEAIEHYRRALRIRPDYAETHNNLGTALKTQRKLREAIQCYHRALQINANLVEAHYNLAMVFKEQGEPEEAIEHYRKALQRKPSFPEAHYNLGIALASVHKFDEAFAHLREAMRLKPESPIPPQTIAWLMATGQNPNANNAREAVRLAKRAVKLAGGRDPRALDALAAAYAASDQFDLAVAAAQEALSLASMRENEQLSDQISRRLELYGQGKPYIEDPALQGQQSIADVSKDDLKMLDNHNIEGTQ